MLRTLVRLLGLGGGANSPRDAGVRRFTPRLESLDGRTLPGGMAGGVLATGGGMVHCGAEEVPPVTPTGGARGGVVNQVVPFGGVAGGVVWKTGGAADMLINSGSKGAEVANPPIVHGIGEEIPQKA